MKDLMECVNHAACCVCKLKSALRVYAMQNRSGRSRRRHAIPACLLHMSVYTFTFGRVNVSNSDSC